MVLKPEYFDRVRDIGYTELALMIDDAPKVWKPTWTLKQFESFCTYAETFGMKVALTTWPWPDRGWLDAVYPQIDAYCKISFDIGVLVAEESDTERNWFPDNVVGFNLAGKRSLDLAGDDLIDRKRTIAYKYKCESQITTFVGHLEASARADLVPYVNALYLQMYGVAHRKRKNAQGQTETWDVPWEHIYGPGSMQKMSINRADEIPGIQDGKVILAAGLPVWDQTWPGHTIYESIELQRDICIANGVTRFRDWSSKHIVGTQMKRNIAEAVKRYIAEKSSQLDLSPITHPIPRKIPPGPAPGH